MPIAILIGQLLLQYGPDIAQAVSVLLHKTTEPTLDEWLAVFGQIRSWEQIIAGPVAAPTIVPPTT